MLVAYDPDAVGFVDGDAHRIIEDFAGSKLLRGLVKDVGKEITKESAK
jgi:hypothetical protein